MRKPPQRKIARGRKAPAAAAVGGKRKVYFGGRFHPTQVFWRPALLAGNRITGPALIEEYASTTLLLPGDMLEVDAFGNLMTNFTAEDLPQGADGKINLQVGGKRVEKLAQTFAQGAAGEPVAIVGSSGFVEIAVNKGNASRTLSIGRGTAVVLTE